MCAARDVAENPFYTYYKLSTNCTISGAMTAPGNMSRLARTYEVEYGLPHGHIIFGDQHETGPKVR
jgi:hypothetical protein